MRFQGKITNWKDDQGYGFVIPNGGGDKAFVHIKAFSSRGRRPVEGELITYEVEKGSKNRTTAIHVRYVGDAASASNSRNGLPLGAVFSVGLVAFLAVSIFMKWLSSQIIVLYLATSALTFIAYALDKSAAKSNQWRTKESTLHLFSLIGGWPGALLAQRTLRHKSKKEEFQTVFWVTVIVNCFALGWLITDSGSAFLSFFLG
ncbi:MAG: cold shock and DUF1294 domain-containing protein [Methylophilaceae bacterium]